MPKGGKRPIVELVLRTPEGRYQPIKFRNNSQITENIPRTLFHKVCFRKQPVLMPQQNPPSVTFHLRKVPVLESRLFLQFLAL